MKEPRDITYHCVVGHRIEGERLEVETAIWTLDRGAEVRVCREHGAPVAITVEPAEGAGVESAP